MPRCSNGGSNENGGGNTCKATCPTQPLARSWGERNGRCLQPFVGAAPWDDTALLAEHQRAVQERLGDPEGG
ncbi:MAG: hypothetical protein IT210_15885 [Armatimonadetes bacterium]|nr:hypothetical protein [Armatimonadota bacterium]